jgi:hypothetical protein
VSERSRHRGGVVPSQQPAAAAMQSHAAACCRGRRASLQQRVPQQAVQPSRGTPSPLACRALPGARRRPAPRPTPQPTPQVVGAQAQADFLAGVDVDAQDAHRADPHLALRRHLAAQGASRGLLRGGTGEAGAGHAFCSSQGRERGQLR